MYNLIPSSIFLYEYHSFNSVSSLHWAFRKEVTSNKTTCLVAAASFEIETLCTYMFTLYLVYGHHWTSECCSRVFVYVEWSYTTKCNKSHSVIVLVVSELSFCKVILIMAMLDPLPGNEHLLLVDKLAMISWPAGRKQSCKYWRSCSYSDNDDNNYQITLCVCGWVVYSPAGSESAASGPPISVLTHPGITYMCIHRGNGNIIYMQNSTCPTSAKRHNRKEQ